MEQQSLEEKEHPDPTPYNAVPIHLIHTSAFTAGLERSPERNAAQCHPAPNVRAWPCTFPGATKSPALSVLTAVLQLRRLVSTSAGHQLTSVTRAVQTDLLGQSENMMEATPEYGNQDFP